MPLAQPLKVLAYNPALPMFFSVIIIAFVLLIAFIHFVQGFFSATLSAILTIFAAAIAIGFHESLVVAMKPGKMADSANAVLLCSLFAGSYVVLRLIFDRAVPGNVRLQPTIDKIGAGIMGLVAGIVATGIFAIAAQTTAFGASIFGYSRYAVKDIPEFSVQPDRAQRSLSRAIFEQMTSDKFEDKNVNHMLFPTDDMVLGLVNTLSDGSLSGAVPLSAVHQDYLQEAFGNRVGIEIGARRTANNLSPTGEQVSVESIAVRDKLKAVVDSELPEVRRLPDKNDADPNASNVPRDEAKLAKEELKVKDKQQAILIVRTIFDRNATDEKNDLFRFTPASVRLVVHDARGKARDFYPIGTMDPWSGGTFWPNHIDDVIYVKINDKAGADLVFMIDNRDEVLEASSEAPKKKADGKPTAAAQAIKAGVFLEVKRLARVDLSGKQVEAGALPVDPKIDVMRKSRLKQPPPPVVTQ